MGNNRLNDDTSRRLVTSAIVKAVVLYNVGYFDDVKKQRGKLTDDFLAMGIGIGQDRSILCMDSSLMSPSD